MTRMISPSTPVTEGTRSSVASLWMARDVHALGNWILLIALLAWTYRARESAAVVSILMLGQLLPHFLLSPLAVLLVSPRNALPVGILAQLLRAAALVPLLQAGSDDLRLVLAAASLAALPVAFTQASYELPLRQAMAANRGAGSERYHLATRLLILILGPLAGTALYGIDGLRGCTIAALAALALSSALLLLARPSSAGASLTATRRSLAATLAGFQEDLVGALRHPFRQALATVQLSVALVTGGLVIAQVAFMTWGLFTGVENVGRLLAAEGVGTGIGMAAGGLARRRLLPSTLIATALMVLAFGEFGFAISRWTDAATYLAGAIGVGKGILFISLGGFPLSPLDARFRQTASGGLDFSVDAAVLLSALAMGPLVDSITPRFTIVLSSILLVVLALYAFGAVADRQTETEEESRSSDGAYSSPQTA